MSKCEEVVNSTPSTEEGLIFKLQGKIYKLTGARIHGKYY